MQGLPEKYRSLVNHPSNVVLRHETCNSFDTDVRHGGGTGGDFQVWRAGLHLARWEGLFPVQDYLDAIAPEFPTLRMQIHRFYAFGIEDIVSMTNHTFLQKFKGMLTDVDPTTNRIVHSADFLYEYQRARMYLTSSHSQWSEGYVMELLDLL